MLSLSSAPQRIASRFIRSRSVSGFLQECIKNESLRNQIPLLPGAFSLSLCFPRFILRFPLHRVRAERQKEKAARAGSAARQGWSYRGPAIDILISEMLGAWQIGDLDRLHKDIADDVVVVNGNWAPPVVGWPEYLKAYQAQRARAQQVRMDRTNTLIRVTGNVAWACYQWDFSGIVDGQASSARGQTTLILEKRNDAWIIVHDHLPSYKQLFPRLLRRSRRHPQPNPSLAAPIRASPTAPLEILQAVVGTLRRWPAAIPRPRSRLSGLAGTAC